MRGWLDGYATQIAILLALASAATAQVRVQGITQPRGALNMSGQAGVHQYTHIWAFSPPNNTGGVHDNDYFRNHVMPSIDGVSVIEGWVSTETQAPDALACAPSDTCQPDPAITGMYHHYVWGTYDSTAPHNPVYQWFDSFSGLKKVNLLITGEDGGTANSTTPHYVTSSVWYNLFSPQKQEVINALKDCSGSPWTGVTGGTVSTWSTTTVTVAKTGCCSTVATETNVLQTGDQVWVTSSTANLATGTAGSSVTVNSADSFSYTAVGTGTASSQAVTYISSAQSWPVPYELPYKNALKAYWAAVLAHYDQGFGHFSQLNYFRFGGSVGSEWYPYCVSGTHGGGAVGLTTLAAPYTYYRQNDGLHPVGTYTGWLNYYQEMGAYLQTLGPPWQIIHSINSAEVPVDYSYGTSEAGYAIGYSNRFGVRDGLGSQGLSAQDYVNCVTNNCDSSPPNYGPPNSASNWHPMFLKYNASGAPLELQPSALSYPGDTDCTSPACGTGNGSYSGDLPTFLYPFSINAGATDVEVYWRDLSLAYDSLNYCSVATGQCALLLSITTGNQLNGTNQINWFTTVGIGTSCGGSQGAGTCSYQTNLNAARGQH